MKSNMLLKILAAVCAVALLAAAWMMPLANAEQDHVGDGETNAAIRELKINWTSGKVHIAYHSGNTILISEKITGRISDDMRMRWRVEGDTLTVEYDQPGFHLFSLLPHEKELTGTLPGSLTLEKANISATSNIDAAPDFREPPRRQVDCERAPAREVVDADGSAPCAGAVRAPRDALELPVGLRRG